jgi:hypothetical protein
LIMKVGLSRLALFLISASTLLFEINLTRLFSVSQFYHFAFMIVSLALLGYGASGTLLSLFPKLRNRPSELRLRGLSFACALSILGAYLLFNWLPFDSFSIAWDSRQLVVLAFHYIALASPFFFCGMAVGLMLSTRHAMVGAIYAVNLFGSAFGCVLSLIAPALVGGEGTVILSCTFALLAALISFPLQKKLNLTTSCMSILLAFCLIDMVAHLSGRNVLPVLDLRMSPYKGLSYALQYPGSELISRRWNAFSRVDLVRSPGIRSLPGISINYPHIPPDEMGLFVDGDDLSPVIDVNADKRFASYMPGAIVFLLRPEAKTAVLEPQGGLDIELALTMNARQVVAVEANPLVVAAAAQIYQQPRVLLVTETDRSFLHRTQDQFDVIILSLSSAYHPVRSGAYSLGEDYRYTVEAFQDSLARLNQEGVFVVTRWLQTPPSEFLRAFAIAVTALEQRGLNPAERIVAFRSFNTGTLLVKTAPFNTQELTSIRFFISDRSFDLVYAPDIHPEETNRFNILPESIYYLRFQELLSVQPRADWYAAYPFDVTPPTDDRPFFGNYFKWTQTGQIMAEIGKVWQPFGGAGYFVLLVLLAIVLVISLVLVLLPLVLRRYWRSDWTGEVISPRLVGSGLVYFGMIGLAYLLIEIPLIQRFILFLGYPSYAMTAVIFTLLLFSGLGSLLANCIPHRLVMLLLVGLALIIPWLLPLLFNLTLGLSLLARLAVTVIILAPLGFLMGIPFPAGIRLLGLSSPQLIPWVWSVNGASSVISSVLAAILALSFGFNRVLFLGALCYAGAGLMVSCLKVGCGFRRL